MKISLAQIDANSSSADFNLSKIETFIEDAKNKQVDLVVFPEMSDVGYDMDLIVKNAQCWDHGTITKLKDISCKYDINVAIGLSERENDNIFNSIAIINRKGELVGKYRKTHLITADPINEDHYIKAGDSLCILDIEGINIGFLTCYELRFPELARKLALSGVELLIIPAAWPLVRLPHWQCLTQARAIENQYFVAAVSRIGADAGIVFSGSSVIYDPYGNILSSGTQIHEQNIVADLDFDRINTIRNQIKVYQDRRSKLYV